MSDIASRARSFIVENFFMGRQADNIGNDTSFLALGLLDSTGVIELVSFLEQTFQIKVEDAEMIPENLDTLGCIERYVQTKMGMAIREAVS